MKILNEKNSLIFLGDNHGAWNSTLFDIDKNNIENAHIISVGDLGVGFEQSKEHRDELYNRLNSFFRNKNINFYGIRGNHDDPAFFKDSNRMQLSNFELIEDYSIFQYGEKKIKLIGGAISIDRTGRQEGVSYWKEEGVIFNQEKLQTVDILVTHTAPSWCFPQQFNEMVYGWAREDTCLIRDLTDERAAMDEIFKVCQPSFHVYGHFHSSCTERVNGCVHKLLNIGEMYQLI
jgi:UDP-2,3-diacylglucosamine pyrophosphatase LpxH